MVNCFDVANYFLAQCDEEAGDLISNMKLQKLVYYAQGLHLAIYGEIFFPEPIEAWQHGPVVPDLYHQYKKYEGNAIPVPKALNFDVFSEEQKGLMNEVYDVYGQFSAWKLRNMTHVEPPWKDAAQSGSIISHDSMKQYFKSQLN